jgi:hypothetical protein
MRACALCARALTVNGMQERLGAPCESIAMVYESRRVDDSETVASAALMLGSGTCWRLSPSLSAPAHFSGGALCGVCVWFERTLPPPLRTPAHLSAGALCGVCAHLTTVVLLACAVVRVVVNRGRAVSAPLEGPRDDAGVRSPVVGDRITVHFRPLNGRSWQTRVVWPGSRSRVRW